jgi:hypothetical protein
MRERHRGERVGWLRAAATPVPVRFADWATAGAAALARRPAINKVRNVFVIVVLLKGGLRVTRTKTRNAGNQMRRTQNRVTRSIGIESGGLASKSAGTVHGATAATASPGAAASGTGDACGAAAAAGVGVWRPAATRSQQQSATAGVVSQA